MQRAQSENLFISVFPLVFRIIRFVRRQKQSSNHPRIAEDYATIFAELEKALSLTRFSTKIGEPIFRFILTYVV
jgi:hypothetical protein